MMQSRDDASHSRPCSCGGPADRSSQKAGEDSERASEEGGSAKRGCVRSCERGAAGELSESDAGCAAHDAVMKRLLLWREGCVCDEGDDADVRGQSEEP